MTHPTCRQQSHMPGNKNLHPEMLLSNLSLEENESKAVLQSQSLNLPRFLQMVNIINVKKWNERNKFQINLEVISKLLFCGPPLHKPNIHSSPLFILSIWPIDYRCEYEGDLIVPCQLCQPGLLLGSSVWPSTTRTSSSTSACSWCISRPEAVEAVYISELM